MNHPIRIVARRTGLSPHVIRIWEKRYGAVQPLRTPSNRRLYSEAEIDRLVLLQQAVRSGHSIGQIATLPLQELSDLIAKAPPPDNPDANPSMDKTSPDSARNLILKSLDAVRHYDGRALEQHLERAAITFGSHGCLHKVVLPLTQEVGALWETGEIKASHEHFATAAIRSFLVHSARPYATPDTAPRLVVATPAGQLHEMGAIVAAAAATNQGWRVIYLGTSLPASEIAGTVIQNQARAVALSIVYPQDDPALGDELLALRRLLPREIQILAGGRASRHYRHILEKIDAQQIEDLTAFCRYLDDLRSRPLFTRSHTADT